MNTVKNVNTANLSDKNVLKFKPVPTITNMVDVMYKNERIAIINGFSAPLEWTAKNGSNIPLEIITKIENLVRKNIIN
jgi:hypothetical protein